MSSYGQYRKKEDDSAYDASSESDDDDKPVINKRSKPTNTFSKPTGYNFGSVTTAAIPNTCFGEAASLDVFNMKARELKEDRKNKKNDIWQDIAAEGMVSDIADSFFTGGSVRPDDALQQRGSEQYLNRRLRKRKIGDRAHYQNYETDSEISSDGLSDDSLEFVRAKRGKTASVMKSTFTGGRAVSVPQTVSFPVIKPKRFAMDAPTENSSQCPLKMETGSHPQTPGDQDACNNNSNVNGVNMECGSSEVRETTMDVQDEEQKQNPPLEPKKWKSVLQARFRHLDDNEFGNKMVRHLQEQRNPGVIQKAVQILGQEECIRLLHKTLKIRRSGGIVIKKKTRMRTTGGTFLYLIRNDKRVSSDKKEAVLHDEGLQPSTTRKNVDDKPQKVHHSYGGGITQRIMARHGGMPQTRIDLESDKFSLPSNPAEVHEAATKASTNRTEVSYDDLDLLDFEF